LATILAEGRASSRFELLAPLGRGGFGTVYEARDARSGQRVALKELGQASGDNLARFKQEFRALSGLHHENLVGLSELLEQDGKWFIVMELIEGSDFLSHVRGRHDKSESGREYDEARLRHALSGMAVGLTALHEFGVLHRDLKPSNVRVSHEGRAVLLDFGLVTSVDPSRQSTHGLAMGTVAYMAPEQAIGSKIGPSADWYALGVCLFEALSDRLPFEGGSGFELLLRKQQSAAPRVSEFARDVPKDLDDLCQGLLARDPKDRPSGREVLQALGVAQRTRGSEPHGSALSLLPTAAATFAGREAEIENLGRALKRTHEGELRIVLVEGESGVGKSEMVAEFLRAAKLQHVSLAALSGRCYENEQVPYKAFDGCVDELAKLLRRLPDSECQSLLPARAALLGQLFPVLNHVPRIARAPRAQLPADPTSRRLEAFAAFAELLGKLAEERPLVLVIDDLQWADAESFRLLKALIEHRERPPILVLATIRPREELEPDVLEQVEKVRAFKFTDVQPLFGLPRAQAETLVRNLLGPLAEGPWIRNIAEESRGHPLLLSELVHYARSRDAAAASALSLDDALKARMEGLDRSARELVELVAIAGRPCGSQVFAQALSLASVDDIARPLLMTKLLRKRRGQELGCYHDRIRHAAVDLIPRTRLPALHRRLARALAADPQVDPAELARHWELAGELDLAVAAYEKAAESAQSALAFLRAAELSGRALTLSDAHGDARHARLLVQRARALACAGRSAEAATLYSKASDLSEGEQRIRLRSSAANQLMLSAQVEKGLSAARDVLGDLAVRLPLGTRGALLRFAWDRLSYVLFDRVFGRRSRAEARDRLALEVIAVLNRSIALLHLPAYLALNAQHLRLAAALADPAQLMQSYAIQGWLRTVRGSLAAGRELFEKSRRLCADLNRPELSAWQAISEGTALLTGWDAPASEACMLRCHELLQAHCPDQPRELTTVRMSLGLAWYFLGDTRRLAQESTGWLREARERDDHLGVALLVGAGCGYMRHLLDDAPEKAVAELDESLAKISTEPFAFAQLGHMFAVITALRYQGGTLSLAWLDARKQDHERRFLLRAGFGRATLRMVRMLALMQAAASFPERERARAFKEARQLAGKLTKIQSPFVSCLARLQLVQLDAFDGNSERALETLRALSRALPKEFRVNHACHRYLEGVLEASPAGRERCEAALADFAQMGYKNPERALNIALPALPLLQSRARKADTKHLLLERYEVIDSFGSAGFGNVVSARDALTGRTLALKELTGKHARSLERFKREFRVLQTIHHENLIGLDALFEHEGAWYIAMELVEGADLLSHVRGSGRLDLERLREAFSGLVRGLSALHDAGLVHRDVRPANVRVSSTGRTLLIDFGLIARAGDESDEKLLGSAEHAAPEQLEGRAAQSAADVYAVGVCLYQALTGRLPFGGETPLAVLQNKRTATPDATPGAPHAGELALCLSMLARDPSARPTLSEVLRVLSPLGAGTPSLARVSQAEEGETPFSGRAEELARLLAAFDASRRSGLSIAIVRGESGVGKSSLMAEFTRVLSARQPNVLILNSRCYENEQVALKAFDDAVDQLARVLSQLPEIECSELLPKKAALLVQLFPVLAWVPAIAGAGKKGLPADPAARKLAAFECFFQLLERVSTRFSLVFTVDDLQWADGESFRMLEQLLLRRATLPILIACTSRDDDELEADAAREIGHLAEEPGAVVLSLSGLAGHDATRYAAELLSDSAPDQFVQQLVVESKGHPLFLRELVARAMAGNLSLSAPSLDDALRARIERLDVEARTVLVLVALAGRPIRASVLAAALGRSELPREAVVSLLAQGTLKKRGQDELACYHDRIRHAALSLFDEAKRRELARRLAQALGDESTCDAAERARLWEQAGDAEQAISAYEQAGDQALSGLTFVQADQHYKRALQLLGERQDEVFRRVSIQRGHALVRMGNSAEAARHFQRAAQVATGELKIRLRIWAAQQLIQSAQVEEGLAAANAVLTELALPFANDDRSALVRIAWERARIALRGTKLRREAKPMTARERLVLDALTDLSAAVRAVSYLPGSTMVIQYLRRALSSGEARHSARALAYEALWRSVGTPDKSPESLFDQARELADQTNEPAVIAEVELMRGLACTTRGEFRSAPRHLWIAHDLLQTQCPGQPWLLTSARMYLGQTWIYTGESSQLQQHTGLWLDEARAKQDRYAVAAIAGFGGASYRTLMQSTPEAALALLDEAMAPWPDEPFSTNHFGDMFARTGALAQLGGDRLLSWLSANHARLERAYLLRAPTPRLALLWRWTLASLSAIPSSATATSHPLFAQARRYVPVLARQRTGGVAPGSANLLRSALALLEGRAEEAAAHARAAQPQLSGVVFLHGARYLEGAAIGGSQGKALCEATLLALSAEGWARPKVLLREIVPGLDLIEARL
jgi:eukaryotic-like serine/threonine-protein kinase